MDELEISSFGSLNEPLNASANFESRELPSLLQFTLFRGNDELMKQNRLFLSAGLTACMTSSFYNPLDCLRIRWQTLPSSHKLSSQGVVYFTNHIIRTEGIVNGLWRPGVVANALGMGSSAALRFGFYENVRDAFQGISYDDGSGNGSQDEDNKKGIHMFLAGLTCGAMAYFVTSPFHLVKTLVQAEKNNKPSFQTSFSAKASSTNGSMSVFNMIVKERGILGLWRGSLPLSARGALFTSGQMLGYDGFKTFCKDHGLMDDGAKLHIASSIVAAFGATLLSTPADFVLSRYVASTSETTLSHCIKVIYKENGIIGFWRGYGIGFIRVCPVMLSYSTIYEQLRHYFGLGYLS